MILFIDNSPMVNLMESQFAEKNENMNIDQNISPLEDFGLAQFGKNF